MGGYGMTPDVIPFRKVYFERFIGLHHDPSVTFFRLVFAFYYSDYIISLAWHFPPWFGENQGEQRRPKCIRPLCLHHVSHTYEYPHFDVTWSLEWWNKINKRFIFYFPYTFSLFEEEINSRRLSVWILQGEMTTFLRCLSIDCEVRNPQTFLQSRKVCGFLTSRSIKWTWQTPNVYVWGDKYDTPIRRDILWVCAWKLICCVCTTNQFSRLTRSL